MLQFSSVRDCGLLLFNHSTQSLTHTHTHTTQTGESVKTNVLRLARGVNGVCCSTRCVLVWLFLCLLFVCVCLLFVCIRVRLFVCCVGVLVCLRLLFRQKQTT